MLNTNAAFTLNSTNNDDDWQFVHLFHFCLNENKENCQSRREIWPICIHWPETHKDILRNTRCMHTNSEIHCLKTFLCKPPYWYPYNSTRCKHSKNVSVTWNIKVDLFDTPATHHKITEAQKKMFLLSYCLRTPTWFQYCCAPLRFLFDFNLWWLAVRWLFAVFVFVYFEFIFFFLHL